MIDLREWTVTILMIIATLPSALMFFFMCFRISRRKWSLFSFDEEMCSSWSYILLLGGSLATIVYVFKYHALPRMDKIFMDIAICLYFFQRSIRLYKFKQHQKNTHKGLNYGIFDE